VDLSRVTKKLRETEFFLDKMKRHEGGTSADELERFDFYLSAFLSAARTVTYRLQHEQQNYKSWRPGWDARQSEADRALIKYLVDDRNVEVHESGSARMSSETERNVAPGTYRIANGGVVTVTGPPGMTNAARLSLLTHSFTIEGVEREALEACGKYLGLLALLVQDFKNDHSP
jgi:hypothetical protein